MLTRPNVCTLDFIIRNQINLETEANFEHKTILLNFFHPAWVLPFPYFYLVNSRARQTNITHSHLCIFHLKPTSHPHTDAGAPHEIVFYANNMFDGFFLFFEKFHLYRFAYKSMILRMKRKNYYSYSYFHHNAWGRSLMVLHAIEMFAYSIELWKFRFWCFHFLA